jgi:hypothetical protein
MKNQVTNGFDKLTVSNLLAKANFVISEMTTNAVHFPATNPSLTDVRAATDALQTANLAAENRDKVAIAIRNQKKAALVALLRKLGIYVNLMADGDPAIAQMSGLDLAKPKAPRPAITYVEAPVMSSGVNPGELEARVATVDDARLYMYYITKDTSLPIEQWERSESTKIKFLFQGLESATRYYTRIAAIGVNEQRVFSDVSTYVTQ